MDINGRYVCVYIYIYLLYLGVSKKWGIDPHGHEILGNMIIIYWMEGNSASIFFRKPKWIFDSLEVSRKWDMLDLAVKT